MTQPELNVDPDALRKKADQLEEIRFRALFPLDKPSAPCQVAEALDATWQIGQSHDSIAFYLEDADKQLAELVASLRKSAKEYENSDESAAGAIDNNTTMPTTPEGTSTADTSPAMWSGTPNYGGSWAGSSTDVYVRAREFYDTTDRGASMLSYATALNRYAEYLNDLASITASPFLVHFKEKEWEGTAADSANKTLDDWVEPLKGLSADCTTLAKHALNLRDAYLLIETDTEIKRPREIDPMKEIPRLQSDHKYGDSYKHPRPVTVEWAWNICQGGPDWDRDLDNIDSKMTGWMTLAAVLTLGASVVTGVGAIPYAVRELWRKGGFKVYAALQEISDAAMAKFREKAGFGTSTTFPQVSPQWKDRNPANGGSDRNPYIPDKLLSDTSGAEAGLPTMPTMPTLPTDVPSDVPTDVAPPTDGVLGGVGTGSPKLPAGGLGGMRAASVGGGGVPLQPPVAAEAAGSAAGRGGPNLGGAGAMGGAAMGGRGGMGMVPPMAGQGGKGEDSKAKRAQQDEEALYAEDRPWTEAVIGNRRRKDGPDNKESK